MAVREKGVSEDVQAGKESSRSQGKKVSKIFRLVLPIAIGAITALTVVGVVACSPKTQTAEETAAATVGSKLDVTTADATKVITAEQWKAIYPNEYNSMMLNQDDSETVSYLEEDPYLTTIYAGTPFSKDYAKARGHYYALTDVQATKRISDKTKATCYGCKGSYYPSNETAGNTSIYKSRSQRYRANCRIQLLDAMDNPGGHRRVSFAQGLPARTSGVAFAPMRPFHNEFIRSDTFGRFDS